MSNQPKAKWTCDGENYWIAYVGTYRLCADGKDGMWFVEHDDTDAPLDITVDCGTPCDVVTLMLAAESALATHLRSVADSLVWPEEAVAEPAPYAYIALTEIGRQMREAWEKAWPEVSKLARCVVLPIKEHDVTNIGQTEIYVGGLKLEPGATYSAVTDARRDDLRACLIPAVAAPRATFKCAFCGSNMGALNYDHGVPTPYCASCKKAVK